LVAALKVQGAKLRNLFFSFSGRLGRLGFLFRGMALGITAGVLLTIGLVLTARCTLGFHETRIAAPPNESQGRPRS
jgi:uncharacterized membrane protein YhaH (DUF805 family)